MGGETESYAQRYAGERLAAGDELGGWVEVQRGHEAEVIAPATRAHYGGPTTKYALIGDRSFHDRPTDRHRARPSLQTLGQRHEQERRTRPPNVHQMRD